jgi:hypothetical protein
MICRYCRSRHIRYSRWRFEDIPQLLLLRVPVRCWLCQERVYVSVFAAWRLVFSRKSGRNRPRRVASGASAKRNSAAA